jgi:hypothetical protein
VGSVSVGKSIGILDLPQSKSMSWKVVSSATKAEMRLWGNG